MKNKFSNMKTIKKIILYFCSVGCTYFSFSNFTLFSMENIISTEKDFETWRIFSEKHLSFWNWTNDEKNNAFRFSSYNIEKAENSNELLLRLKISKDFPWKKTNANVFSLGKKYFPPDADIIRMNVKVLHGEFILSVGGPTAYYGNSDAFARPILLKENTKWQTINFSLHEGLIRNYRRAEFSSNAHIIYYNRWAQEPTSIVIFKRSFGEILIKEIKVISTGIGKKFPDLNDSELELISTLINFDSPSSIKNVFTVLSGGDNSMKTFENSWTRKVKITHLPPELSVVEENEKKILKVNAPCIEEVKFFAVKVYTDESSGNALSFKIKIDTNQENYLLPNIKSQPLDFILLSTESPDTFNWELFAPNPEWKTEKYTGYDYNIAYDRLKTLTNLSIGIFHARRFLPISNWNYLTIPLIDFAPIYLSDSMGKYLKEQNYLPPSKLIAIGILAPWSRSKTSDIFISLEKIDLSKVSDIKNHSSYPHLDPLKNKIIKTKAGNAIMLFPGENPNNPELKLLENIW